MFFFGFNIFPGWIGLLTLPLSILAAVWTYLDARRRGLSAWLWAGISFSFFPFGFTTYLVYRVIAPHRLK